MKQMQRRESRVGRRRAGTEKRKAELEAYFSGEGGISNLVGDEVDELELPPPGMVSPEANAKVRGNDEALTAPTPLCAIHC